MFRKAALIAALAMLTWPAYAGDPWKDKTYKEWDEKETRKIMNDSPWAKQVTVQVAWREGQSLLDNSPSGTSKSQSGPDMGRGKTGTSTGSGGKAGADDTTGPRTPEATFIIRWSSAKTMRQAMARFRQLKGGSEAEVEKFLAETTNDLQVAVLGQDMTPFAQTDESTLKDKTSLRPKKSKLKLSPQQIDILRTPDGKRVNGVVFHFNTKTETGELVITADEKGIEFECKLKDVSVKTSFDPQKMSIKGGPDL